jgi:hypothetical protein
MFLTSPLTSSTTPGDLNKDGQISISDIVIGLKTISNLPTSNHSLSDADINGDQKIDLADIIEIFSNVSIGIPPNSYPTTLNGYIWLVTASFTNTEDTANQSKLIRKRVQSKNIIPITYSFAISINNDHVTSTAIQGFDPTKGILRQNLSTSGEIPGAKRQTSVISSIIPTGTEFNYQDNKNGTITLTSQEITIPGDDPKNPLGMPLQRTWTLSIDFDSVFNGAYEHGTITEETLGFLPDDVSLVSIGDIYLVPFQPVNLTPVE